MFIFLVDKQTNGSGTIRRVCSLIDLSSSTPIKDCQPYNTFNGAGKCFQTSIYYLVLFIMLINSCVVDNRFG